MLTLNEKLWGAKTQEEANEIARQAEEEFNKQMMEEYGKDWDDENYHDDYVNRDYSYRHEPLSHTIARIILNKLCKTTDWDYTQIYEGYSYTDAYGKEIPHALACHPLIPFEYTENGSPIDEDNFYPEAIIIDLDALENESSVRITTIDEEDNKMTVHTTLNTYL